MAAVRHVKSSPGVVPKGVLAALFVPRTASRHAKSCFALSKAPMKRCFRLDHRKIQETRLSLK